MTYHQATAITCPLFLYTVLDKNHHMLLSWAKFRPLKELGIQLRNLVMN